MRTCGLRHERIPRANHVAGCEHAGPGVVLERIRGDAELARNQLSEALAADVPADREGDPDDRRGMQVVRVQECLHNLVQEIAGRWLGV